jgi:hypothetical protein
VYEAISIEEMNKPAVALCNKGFFMDARSSASVKGMPGVRLVLETVPPHSTVTEEIEKGVSAAMDDIIAALTNWACHGTHSKEYRWHTKRGRRHGSGR